MFEKMAPKPGEPKKRQFLVFVSKDSVPSVQKTVSFML